MNRDCVTGKIAYVVKRYPRFSETFIVNEVLAHEASGCDIDLFSLRPPVDTHFQDLISRVRAPLTYLSNGTVKAEDLWAAARRCIQQSCSRDGIEHAMSESALDAFCGFQLAHQVILRGVKHIHAHFASSATNVARIASRLTGVPYTFTAHAKDIFHESVDPQDLSDKLKDAKLAFTVSDYNVNHFAREFSSYSHKVVRLYNGIHLDDFPYACPKQRSQTIVAVGRFVEKKGFDVLIDACRILQSKGTKFRCILIGGGELEAELAGQIEQLGLQQSVQIVGPQPQREVKRLVQSAALLAAPCIDGTDGNRDGLPTVLLEAMALGTPCISTDVTGIPEVVIPEHTGLLVKQRDTHALASGMQRLLDDDTLRSNLAKAARSLIEREFNINQNCQAQRQVFFAPTPATLTPTPKMARPKQSV